MHIGPSFKIYESSSGANQQLVVVENHFGSGLNTDLPHKAERMAEHLGMAVMAYERPATGTSRTFALGVKHELAPSRITQASAQNARQLQRTCESLGYDQVILTGNSSGALDMALMVASENIRPDNLVLGDMVGVRHISHNKILAWCRGFRLWARYQTTEEAHKPASENNTEPAPDTSGRDMVFNQLTDVWNYSALWPTDIGRKVLQKLATENSFATIPVYLALPEHTFTATPNIQAELIEELHQIRPNFWAEQVPGAYHSRWDDPKQHAYLVQTALNKAAL